MKDPKRYSLGWFLRLPAMVRRKQAAGQVLLFTKKSKTSYAQFGEDILVESIFWHLGVSKPSYLDIGAYAPSFLSNTYYFYKRGCRGVCVEPNPALISRFRRARRRDFCLNAGVGSEDAPGVPFYVLSEASLSTFDKAGAQAHEARSQVRIRKIASVPVYSINTIIEKYCHRCPDFLSVDVEGMDLELLQAMDFERFRPTVICVETADFATHKKQQAIIDFLCGQAYHIQADTIVNTIFVDGQAWAARQP